MQTIKQSILSIAIGLALVAGLSYADWGGAQGNPPTSNAPAPINVSLNTQTFGDPKLNNQNKTLSMGNGTSGILSLNGSLNVSGSMGVGGVSMFKGGKNKDGFTSFFPNNDGKNYIRGTTILADTDKDNYVGIGTNAPQAKLHLKAGNEGDDPWAFRLEQGQIASGNVLTSDTNGNAYWAELPSIDSGYEVKTATGYNLITAYCSASKKILGGGCQYYSESLSGQPTNSYPIISGNNGWVCGTTSTDFPTMAYAICAN